jgi:hypothetical protein
LDGIDVPLQAKSCIGVKQRRRRAQEPRGAHEARTA